VFFNIYHITKMEYDWLSLAGWISLCLGGGMINGFQTRQSITTWYEGRERHQLCVMKVRGERIGGLREERGEEGGNPV
jgi:hypothetical protein